MRKVIAWIVQIILFFTSHAVLIAQELTSSNLPIIVIDTDGQQIVDEPKVSVHMGVINNGPGNRNNLTDPFNDYDGDIAIEVRGNASQSFDKKPYVFETRTSAGEELDVALMGLPPESDWILSAAFIDKTLLRDPLAYEMSRRTGRWASHTIHCELVINGEYKGVYILIEKIKRDKHRLNISKITPLDNGGESITGGYIYEISQDGAGFDQRRRFVYPKAEDITSAQTGYIKKYDDDFRSLMLTANYADPETGYNAWIDVPSFIDEILVQEATKNSDAYGWSSYFHKDRAKKLEAGPAWDFDQAFSNSTFNDGPNYSQWTIMKPLTDQWLAENHPHFWSRLFNDAKFKRRLCRRWAELRADVWKTESLFQYIDSTAENLDEAQQRNFERWPVLGVELWRSTPGFQSRDTYQKEVEYLKTFLGNRLDWMDNMLLTVVTGDEESEDQSLSFQTLPNPTSGQTEIRYTLQQAAHVRLELIDVCGKTLTVLTEGHKPATNHHLTFDAESLAPGIYICKLTVNSKTLQRKVLVRR